MRSTSRPQKRRGRVQSLCAWLFPPHGVTAFLRGRARRGTSYIKSAGVKPTPGRRGRAPMQDTIEVAPRIKVTPLSPACGAEISGVDLSKPLSEHEVNAIKAAWGKHLVLVFRGQQVSQEDQLRFASYFGDLGTRKKAPEALRARTEGVQQDNEKVLLVSNIKVDGKPIGAFGEGEFWFHIDSGYTPRPYKYTFLYALELPSRGGNTMFANMYKAYEAVPPALKEKLKGKTALHIHEYNRAKQANSSGDISGIPHHAHPIFITHPDTGRKTLFVD